MFNVRCFLTYTPGGTRTPNRRFWRPLLYQLSYWRFPGKLIENFADATRADGFSALANSETNGLLHRDRRDQFDFNRDVITRHDHFHAFGQLDRTGHVRGAEIELRPVIGEERRVPAAFLLAQHVNFRLEFLVRRNRPRLGDDLPALDVFLLQAAQQNAHVIAGARFIEKLAEHFDIG